jgi:hypothetical protein
VINTAAAEPPGRAAAPARGACQRGDDVAGVDTLHGRQDPGGPTALRGLLRGHRTTGREWAAAAHARLIAEPTVEQSRIEATRQEDELDRVELAGLTIEVILESPDRVSAAALVEQSVVAALFDVIGDEEAGWTAQPWDAIAAEDR